jgi:diadenosine tetraphosphatase ApaH/serine/threonine PP2A family protein phosphatase
MTLVHGSPRDPIREYVTTAGVALENLALLETDFGLHGHTHVPVAFCLGPDQRLRIVAPDPGGRLELDGQRALVNPGSVGQPRDGDPDASYLILDPEAATVTWHRVAYGIATVQAAIRAAGLPGRLADRLAFGA